MIKYLTTQGINFYLEELLKNARTRIVLISPFLQLQRRIKEILTEKKEQGIEIIFVCRVKDLKEDLSAFATKTFDCPTLHAKCYMNENEAIVTSLNLYEFSQQNNDEMGFYIKNGDASEQVFSEISSEAERLCKQQIYGQSSPTSPPAALTVGKKYSSNQLDEILNFDYKGRAGIKKSHSGDIVLFSNTSISTYNDTEKDGIIYYHGQNTGPGKQKLIFGNKDIYDSFENKSVAIHLLKNYVYAGTFYVKEKPFLENGKWVFPLAKKI